jgi:serine/threonine-protein phosphatase 2A regulatory subunit B
MRLYLVAVFEEPEDPTNRSFFSEIISSISDVKLSNSGRYMISRDYLSVKVWDLHMETKPIESYPVSEEFLVILSVFKCKNL